MSGLSKYLRYLPSNSSFSPSSSTWSDLEQNLFRQVLPLNIFSFPHAAKPCFNSGPLFHSPCPRFLFGAILIRKLQKIEV